MTPPAPRHSDGSFVVASFDARGVLTNQRRRLTRLAKQRREQDAFQARLALTAAQRAADEQPDARSRVAASLNRTLRTVATTWSLDVRFVVRLDAPSTQVQWAGDVLAIHHPAPDLISDKGAIRIDRLRHLVADVKGLAYHEVGHRLHTLPFSELLRHVGRSAYGADVTANSRAWAVLEDQRMEARMVADSPVLGNYFATTVIRHLARHRLGDTQSDPPAGEWLLVAGRAHVPATVRDPLRAAFVRARGQVHAATAERLVAEYCAATTVADLWRAVVEFARFVDDDLAMPIPASGLGDEGRAMSSDDKGSGSTGTPMPRPRQQVAESLAASATTRPPTTPRDASSPRTSAATQSDGGSHHTSGPMPGGGSPSDHAAPEPHTLGDQLRQSLEHAERSRLADHRLDSDVADVMSAVDAPGSALPRRKAASSGHQPNIDDADLAAQLMVEALRTFTSDSAPMWQARQARGVLDPFAFRTRQPGTRDHFRACVGDGDQTTDLAVSLLLDVSGSMEGRGADLGAAAYACKYACDQLRIPCTVTLFSGRGYMLWDVGEEPVHVALREEGTTDPTAVCEALDSQQHGRRLHLVLMLTDGAFDREFGGLARYWRDDRAIVLIGLGESVARAHANTTGVHQLLCISSVLDLPHTVTNVLSSLV